MTVLVDDAGPLAAVTWLEHDVPQRREFADSAAAWAFFNRLSDRYCAAILGPHRPKGGSGLRGITYIPAVGDRFFGQIVERRS